MVRSRTVTTMNVMVGDPRRLGVPASEARLRFEAESPKMGSGPGRRVLAVDGKPAFELSFWCGSCQFLFRRLEGANEKLSLESVQERLAEQLPDLDDGVLDAFGTLLPEGDYLPLLLSVEPHLVVPGQEGDYFSHEAGGHVGPRRVLGAPGVPAHAVLPHVRDRGR